MKKNKLLSYFMTGFLMLGVAACGGDDDDDDNDFTNVPQEQQAQTDGEFVVDLQPANPLVAPNARGLGALRLNQDDFNVNLAVTAPAGKHMQHIHVGTACPTMANDTNGDGYLDAAEASAVSGSMLVPLDSDLSGQMEGHMNYPRGNYSYQESTSFATLQNDLWLPDPDPADALAKLTPNEEFIFEGKVIEVHGVASSVSLPASVGTIEGKPAHETIPIACGVIRRVNQNEETNQEGTSPTGGANPTDGTTPAGGTTGGTTLP